MDYLKEVFRLQAENKEHQENLKKWSEALGLALSILMPEKDNLTEDEKKEREKIYFAVESCVQGFCTSSHAIGYNDCMLEMAKYGAAHKPIIYPEQ